MKMRLHRVGLRTAVGALVAGLGGAAIIAMATVQPTAQQQGTAQGFIQGTVTSGSGPEAGVWVIAETNDLQTKLIKIVVTDDRGRYVLPELPNASYSLWVRGYGLSDSKPVQGKPGQTVDLKATKAASPAEAAKVYPANYWYSMLEVPGKDQFPGKGADANGVPPLFRTQAQFIDQLKQGCQLCHQLGNEVTRTLTHMKSLSFKTSLEAWDYRVKTGQRGGEMDGMMNRLGPAAKKMYADWTDRIAAGELPAHTPPRPKGVERNVVVTMWDWGSDTSYMHDEVATAKAKPTVNANGPVYAVDAAHGKYIAVNMRENSAYEIPIPTRDDPSKMRSRFPQTQVKPSNFWGNQIVHSGVSDPHNPMFDSKGRLWSTSTVSQG
ncbi:MAG: carboxypeptidase-like regulatory domain-containing protein, partial [Vicinamibacterales bacterium]